MKQLYLIDAYAFIFRAYYAFAKNPRLTTKGEDTSAIFGFVNLLNDLLRNYQPEHIAVVFDPPGGSFRKDFYPEYKAQRSATPESIIFAVPYIKALLDAMNIATIEIPRYEADDVIGTLSVKAEQAGYEVLMATPDKDYGQLVTPKVSILAPQKGGGYEEIGVQEVCAKWKIAEPRQLIDILAMMGDSADNYPGIVGVGEVGAVKLIAQYGSLEGIIAHANEIKGKLGEKIRSGIDDALISKRLATIALDVPLEFTPEEYVWQGPDMDAVRKVLEPLELRTALSSMQRYYGADSKKPLLPTKPKESAPTEALGDGNDLEDFGELFTSVNAPKDSIEPKIRLDESSKSDLSDPVVLDRFLEGLAKTDRLYVYVLGVGSDSLQKTVSAVAFMLEGSTDVYTLTLNAQTDKLLYRIATTYEERKPQLVGHDLKAHLLSLRSYGFVTCIDCEDTMIAHYLLMPDMGHSIESLAQYYLSMTLMSFEELIAPQKSTRLDVTQIDAKRIQDYCSSRVHATKQLHQLFIPKLDERHQLHLYRDMEMMLMPILMGMELEGVRIDEVELAKQDKFFQREMTTLEAEIQSLAGEVFNVNSPRQIGEVLFDKLLLDSKAKKTKAGAYTTSEEVLEKYRSKHPIVGKILDYRGLKKLHSTYITALPELADIREHIHTSFNQTVAATGRLSSSNPNIQNIPIRTELGRAIRAAFIPEDGCTFLSADYSQIELRLMAHFSRDPHLIEAFVEGLDIHQATAARIAGVALEDVTQDMRRNAKTANFGIIYGISSFGLSERLGISRTEAKELINGYFASYPGVKEYMDSVITKAREDKYVETLAGRRRYLNDIDSKNAIVRGYAERNAINAPLQGTAADIIKQAMITIDREIKARGLKSRMILQVHDELNFNVPMDELAEMQELVTTSMRQAGEGLLVPLEVGIGHGRNWLEAH